MNLSKIITTGFFVIGLGAQFNAQAQAPVTAFDKQQVALKLILDNADVKTRLIRNNPTTTISAITRVAPANQEIYELSTSECKLKVTVTRTGAPVENGPESVELDVSREDCLPGVK